MILKIKSAKGQEHFLPSKTKAMEGTAERETGSFNLLLLKVQLSIEGPPSLKFRESLLVFCLTTEIHQQMAVLILFILEYIVSSKVTFFRSKIMMKDLILHVLECIFCKQQICRSCLDRCVADSETLWICYLLEKIYIYDCVNGSLIPLLVVPQRKM